MKYTNHPKHPNAMTTAEELKHRAKQAAEAVATVAIAAAVAVFVLLLIVAAI